MTAETSEAPAGRSRLLRHSPFLVALVGGIAIRVVVAYAYRPAIVFWDSGGYYDRALDPQLSPLRPVGYSLILRPVVLINDSLVSVTVFHHVIGLALAVVCYVFLLRRGLPPWGATLATLPLLFDPLQLVLEHYVLSDVVFEGLLVLACLLMLWKDRPGFVLVVAAGTLVGACALVRGAGSFLIVLFVVAALCLRIDWKKLLAFALAASLPVAAYAVVFHETYGKYALATAGPRFLYARLAPIVDCNDPQLDLPSYEDVLCPSRPVGDRPSTNYYMWGKQRGPQFQLVPPPGQTREQVLKDFDKRVVRAEPVVYATAVMKDFAGGFAPTRTYDVPGYPSRYWLFADHYWMLESKRWHPRADPQAAGFLQSYRHVVYTPGPLNAALLMVALAAALGVGRARRSSDRVAIGLMAGSCVLTLLTGAALSGFSWRYQLPQIPLLPLAGALGVAALVRGRSARRPEPAPPLRLLDRAADIVARIPGPWRPRVREAVDRGKLQWSLAVVGGLVAGVVTGLAAIRSGWFLVGSAATIGTGIATLTMVLLSASHRRLEADERATVLPEADGSRPTIRH